MDKTIISKIKAKWPDAEVKVSMMKENSYAIEVSTMAFKDMSRLLQQKTVMNLFSDEFAENKLHALTLKTSSK